MSDEPRTILVVDDEEDIREMLEVLLAGEGYRVQVAADGQEALVALDQEVPDLVLLDIMMPGMDGHEVCRRIRARDDLSGTAVLMLTAKDEIDDIALAVQEGADGFVVKPFEVDHFLEVVRFRLDGSGARFYHRNEPVIRDLDAVPERMTSEGRIVFLDLVEPDLEHSVVTEACAGHHHCLMSLWQQDLAGDTSRTTALLGFESPGHFGRLLNRVMEAPDVRVEDCNVYRDFHDIPVDIMGGRTR